MPREPVGPADYDFLEALLKRGFVNLPRMLFDYMLDLELDYDTVGKLFAVMTCVGGLAENTYRPYTISRKLHAHDFDQVRKLVLDLAEKDLVAADDEGETFTFSFIPLFSRLRAIWTGYRDNYDEEVAAGVEEPALLAAQKLLGRPLSDREVADIQDWQTTFGFDADMVQAVIREGQRQGVTRMSYLNTVARRWSEEGVRSPDEAEDLAERHRKAAGKHKAIVSYLGLKRQLTGAEQTLLDKWTDEWGFSNEVVFRACDESNGVQNPLQYVNRILETWRDKGVRTVADVDQALSERKQRRPASTEPAGQATGKRGTGKTSNVFLQREKMKNYDHVFKKFDD
ncbi:MAG TPA: DnaD domain protein [Symbiobacteriaceae bacterium]|jgi:DnaD/phage-associated family protein